MSDRRSASATAIAWALPLLCAGQWMQPPGPGPGQDRVEVRGAYLQDANTLLNELVLGLARGGPIGRDVRERSSAALRANNRFGQVLQLGVHAVFGDSVLHRAGLKVLVSATHQDQLGLRFRPDAYDLTFFGNARFAGQRADLSGSAFEQQRFQTLGGGLYDARTGSWARLDLVKGQALSGAVLHNATLLTALDGSDLGIRLDGSYRSSDTARTGLGAFNGIGAAVSFAMGFTLPARPDGPVSRITGLVEDLGAVRWNDRSLRADPDTALAFGGFAVDDVFDLDGAVADRDIAGTFGVRRTTGAFWRMLPVHGRLELSTSWPSGWQADLSVAQRALPGFVPLVQATGWRRFGRQQIGISAQYGGFGDLRGGVHGRFRISRWLAAELRLANLHGLLSPRARGLAMQLALVLAP